MNKREKTGIDASTDRIPPKPTKESATGSPTAREALRQRQEPTGVDAPENLGLERRSEDLTEESEPVRPHIPKHDRGAELQTDLASPRAVPVMPANASGRDHLTPQEQDEGIDEESMYDRRPGRDKDRPPSKRP